MIRIFKINIILILLLIACNDSIKYPDGGYDYPKHVADKDTNFYYYPVRNIMPKRDSLSCTVTYLLYKQYDEPNLSIKPMLHDVFRLDYNSALGKFYIITLFKDSIIVKKRLANNHLVLDASRLSPFERNIQDFIFYNYPYDSLRKGRKIFADSLKAANPKLLQPEYFIYLIKKSTNYLRAEKEYTRTTIKLTHKDYKHLVETINNSGYWKMPYSFPCENPGLDGYGYGLEANTRYQYNLVNSGSCDDTLRQENNFRKACQEIINYAHLEKEIFIWSDKSTTDTTKNNLVVQDIQLEDIKQPLSKHKKKTTSRHKHRK